jgi:succinate dehydrogenase / fumarate reductase flavoprotein subunit
MASADIIIVGGGLAGLMATIKAAESGAHVHLFSLVPVKRSHSVCAQGGINGAVNTKGEGDSPWEHFDDTVYGGDFLANQPPVKAMCEAAPGIIHLMDRMGVMFNRTPEGCLTSAGSAGRSGTVQRLPGRQPASSCCMRLMSRYAAGKPKAW